MNTLKVVVITIIVAAVPIFGLHDCFLRDENGDRTKTDPNTGLIYHDHPFEPGHIIFLGCKTRLQGENAVCILKHQFEAAMEIITARLTKGSSVGHVDWFPNWKRVFFERIHDPHAMYGSEEYCTVSIQIAHENDDSGNWTLSEFMPGYDGNWVR